MGNTLQKVKSGDPLEIPAATFNTFVFANKVGFVGVTPSASSHAGKFAVLLEPIPASA